MENITIYTTSYPIEFIVNRLYKDHSTIKSIYPDGTNINEYKITNTLLKNYNDIDLYVFNGNRVVEERPIFSKEELSLVRASENYFAECVNDNLEFPMVANYLHKLWYYSMYDVVPVYNHIKGNLSQFYEPGFDYDRWLVDGGSQCLMIFNSSNDSEDNDNYINIDYEDFDILFKNSAGYVIKKKN